MMLKVVVCGQNELDRTFEVQTNDEITALDISYDKNRDGAREYWIKVRGCFIPIITFRVN